MTETTTTEFEDTLLVRVVTPEDIAVKILLSTGGFEGRRRRGAALIMAHVSALHQRISELEASAKSALTPDDAATLEAKLAAAHLQLDYLEKDRGVWRSTAQGHYNEIERLRERSGEDAQRIAKLEAALDVSARCIAELESHVSEIVQERLDEMDAEGEAFNKECWNVLRRLCQATPGFDWKDYPDGMTADEAYEFLREDRRVKTQLETENKVLKDALEVNRISLRTIYPGGEAK